MNRAGTTTTAAPASRRHRLRRWMYAGGAPNRLAKALNRISAAHFGSGRLAARHWVTLEVPGRRTGRVVAFPLVAVDLDGARYLVSMLGEANWVRNVRAAHGHAVLRHGERRAVRLTEVEPGSRAPVLRRFVELAPGARAHVQAAPGAPIEEFERIADRYPVFRVLPYRAD